MELDERTLVAAAAVGAREGATTEVPYPDRALDLGRDVPRSRRGGTGRLRALHGGELAPGEIREERREGPVEDGRLVP
jgi:hypothetical protein